MTNKTRKWVRSGFEVLIHGGTAALVSSISASIIDHDHFPLFSKSFWQMSEAGFVGNGFVRFLQWWSNNPLPPEESDVVGQDGKSVVPQQVISINPLSKVQTIAPAGSKLPDSDPAMTAKP